MNDRFPELGRCDALASSAMHVLEDVAALAALGPAVTPAVRDAVDRLLATELPAIERAMRPSVPPLALRLWELGELEDELEEALATHGWQAPAPGIDEDPPSLTDRIDGLA